LKVMRNLWLALLIPVAAARSAAAQDIQVFADQVFLQPLQEIAQTFTEQTSFEIQLNVGLSAVMAESIRLGLPADVFFPAAEEPMRSMIEKGMVDVALKRNVVILSPDEGAGDNESADVQYAAAAVLVNAPNRLGAMAFLEYLGSDESRAVFARHGYSLP